MERGLRVESVQGEADEGGDERVGVAEGGEVPLSTE
jgi:hypothetical protein